MSTETPSDDEFFIDMRQEGVNTRGCNCGHEDMGRGWHLQGCFWRCMVEAAEREAFGRPEPQRGWLGRWFGRMFGKDHG
jgi:hypothetical protein